MKGKNGMHIYRVTSTKHGVDLHIETELKESKFAIMERLMWGIVHYYIRHQKAKTMWHHLLLMISCVEDSLPEPGRALAESTDSVS